MNASLIRNRLTFTLIIMGYYLISLPSQADPLKLDPLDPLTGGIDRISVIGDCLIVSYEESGAVALDKICFDAREEPQQDPGFEDIFDELERLLHLGSLDRDLFLRLSALYDFVGFPDASGGGLGGGTPIEPPTDQPLESELGIPELVRIGD